MHLWTELFIRILCN